VIGERADIVDQAIAWHLRQSEMAEADWHAFIAWLEADSAHAHAYDRIVLMDHELGRPPELERPHLPIAANDREPAPRRRRGWLWAGGSAAVAAGLAVLAIPLAPVATSQTYVLTTKAGERQDVALADGTRIEVSGGTRLVLDRGDSRVATLESGEATFHVRHDAAHPFTLRSGGITVRDLGTVFNVSRTGAQLDVAVAEGAVMFQPGREALTLKPGNALSAREDLGKVSLSRVDVDLVGGWRSGRLTFAGEPMSSVAATVHRLYGTDLELAPGLSGRPFTGMVRLSGEAGRDVPHLAALVGARWQHDGERWILSPSEPGAR
jgi:transmembrane sensor